MPTPQTSHQRRECDARPDHRRGYGGTPRKRPASTGRDAVAEIPFVDTHFHLHDMKHPDLRYAWLEPGRRARLPRQHRRDQGAALLDRGLYRRDPLRQRAEGDPRPGGARHRRTRSTRRHGCRPSPTRPAIRRASSPNATSRDADAAAVLDRHIAFANVRGIRDFGRGDYLVDPAWRRAFKLLARHNLVYCLDTRIQLFHAGPRSRAHFPQTHDLRRPLRASRWQRDAGIFQGAGGRR